MGRLSAVILLLLGAPAQAQTCPPPEPVVLRGLFVRGAIGPAFWLGDVGQNSVPGVGVSFTAGYELWRILALEAIYLGAFNETAAQTPPNKGSFQTHAFAAGLRLGIPIQAFDLYAQGAVGLSWVSSNVLVRIEGFDSQTRLAWLSGLGLTWHTPRKHIWLGLSGDVLGLLELPGLLFSTSLYLGWTL